MEPVLVLTHLTIVLLFGIIFTLISKKLKIPYMLLLLLAGIGLGAIEYNGETLINFPPIFVNSIGILALVLVVFDASSRFKWREFDNLTLEASKIAISFMFFNLVFLTIFTAIFFNIENIFLALLFSALMSGTSADVVLSIFMNKSNKITNLLEVESILNTPFTVILPFLILSIVQKIGLGSVVIVDLVQQLFGVVQQFVTGIGAGVVIGLVIFKIMKRYYSQMLSPLLLITSTLLTYILAENLSGNGVLAVTVLGLFFGNFYVKKKELLFEFSSTFGNSLMILVFVLVGVQIQLPLNDLGFILKSIFLFAVYVAIRSMAVYVSTMKSEYSTKERIFLTLNIPKGIAVAVIVFSLLTFSFGAGGTLEGVSFVSLPDAGLILNLILVFMLYSLILSTVVNHFSRYFIKMDVEK